MPVDLELSAFEPLVGDTFHVTPQVAGGSFDVVLAAVEPTPYGDPSSYNERKMPFSLVFVANDGTLVPQQTCTFVHDGAGEADLFVVPLGPQGQEMRYEVVIS